MTMENIFSFNFRLDKRRRFRDGTYPIKVNLHSKESKRNLDFGIKPQELYDGTIVEFKCGVFDWDDIWAKKDKLDNFGNVSGEKTVYDDKRNIRTLLRIKEDILNELIEDKNILTAKEFKAAFHNYKIKSKNDSNLYFGLEEISKYHYEIESPSYAKSFITTRNNLREYMKHQPLKYRDITSEWLQDYDNHRMITVSPASVRMDVVNIRTAYNKAMNDDDYLKLNYPFKGGKYSIPKVESLNESLTEEELTKIHNYSSENFYKQRARDYFMTSYYMRGWNLTDLARWEKKKDIMPRKKTRKTSGKLLKVRKLNDALKEVIKRNKGTGIYVFNILEEGMTEIQRVAKIKSVVKSVSENLKYIAKELNISSKLSFRWARNSFTTIANQDENINPVDLQELLGHSKIETTIGYIKSLDKQRDETIDDIMDI